MNKPLLYLMKIMRWHGPRFIEQADAAIRREACDQILHQIQELNPDVRGLMINIQTVTRALDIFREHGRIFKEEGE